MYIHTHVLTEIVSYCYIKQHITCRGHASSNNVQSHPPTQDMRLKVNLFRFCLPVSIIAYFKISKSEIKNKDSWR